MNIESLLLLLFWGLSLVSYSIIIHFQTKTLKMYERYSLYQSRVIEKHNEFLRLYFRIPDLTVREEFLNQWMGELTKLYEDEHHAFMEQYSTKKEKKQRNSAKVDKEVERFLKQNAQK